MILSMLILFPGVLSVVLVVVEASGFILPSRISLPNVHGLPLWHPLMTRVVMTHYFSRCPNPVGISSVMVMLRSSFGC